MSEHPAITDARELLALEDEYWQAVESDYIWRLRQAVLLSPTIEICEALLRGEHVPAAKLDQAWVARFRRPA